MANVEASSGSRPAADISTAQAVSEGATNSGLTFEIAL